MVSRKQKTGADDGSRKYSPTIRNKRARFDYHLLERFEAGIALVGTEVKSLRQGKANLEESFGRIVRGELYLLGCHISVYDHGNISNHEPTRSRKLLVHRREIQKIEVKLRQKGLTLVPVRIYFSRGKVKVEMALGKGKSLSDKRQKLKKEQADREVKQAMRRFDQ